MAGPSQRRAPPSGRTILLLLLATSGMLVSLSKWNSADGSLSRNAELVARQVRTRQQQAAGLVPRGTYGSSQQGGAVLGWSVDGNRLALGRQDGDPGLPAQVPGIPASVVAVAAGGHSMAVAADGALWTWGRNDSRGGGGGGSRGIADSGQLGYPRDPAAPPALPGRLLLPSGVRFVSAAAGRYHSVGLTAEGAVLTWGLDDFSQLGRPGLGGCVGGVSCRDPRPRRVPDLPRIVAVAAGRYHTLALAADGALYTWGLDLCSRPELIAQAAEAGVPPARLALVSPQRVTGGGLEQAKLVAVDAGYVHWVALAEGGAVWTCDTGFDGYAGGLPETQRSGGWRLPNKEGELGRPLAGAASTGDGDGSGGSNGGNSGDAAGGKPSTAGVSMLDGAAAAASNRSMSELAAGLGPGRVPGVLARAVAAGRCFTLAATEPDGRILTWGCGLGGAQASAQPRALKGVGAGEKHGPALRLAGGEWSAAAVTEGGRLLVFGGTGQRQHGSIPEPLPLRQQPVGSHAIAVSAAHQHYMAIIDTRQRQRPWKRDSGRQGSTAAGSAGRGAASTSSSSNSSSEGSMRADGMSAHREQGTAQQQEQEGRQSEREQRQQVGGQGRSVERQEQQQQQWRQTDDQQLQQETNKQVGETPELLPQLRAAAPDIFAALAPFDPAYRNPCFRSRTSGALRCLPFFSITGVSKAGTTDLHRKLMLLPGFKESRNKGPHFWDEDHTFESYLALYDDVAAAAQTDANIVTCDASSNTFTYSGVGIRGKPNSNVLLPALLRAVQPQMRLIVMLRDPVDRLYSGFWYYGCMYGIYKQYGMSAEGFNRFAQEQVDLLSRCLERDGLRACALRHWQPAQQLVKGLYAAFAPDWLQEYPREQLLFINFEQYKRREREHLLRVIDFLGLPAPSEPALASALAAKANRGHRANPNVPGCVGPTPVMLPDTRRMLVDFYSPHNEALAKLLGDASYAWSAEQPGRSR